MFPYRYAHEKLTNAIRILAISPGDVRSRLASAYEEFHTLRLDNFPEELRNDYQWVIDELTKREPQYNTWSELKKAYVPESRVAANLRRMRNSTGSKIARRLYDLLVQLGILFNQWLGSN